MKPKNFGLNLSLEKQQQTGDEWKFGALSDPCLTDIPVGERYKYLPKGELQFTSRADMKDCASRAPLNILETKFNWLLRNKKLSLENEIWLRANGYVENVCICFSDAFVAINSGTTLDGNSLKAPLEAIRKQGLVPKKLLPLLPDMTFETYHDPQRITEEMRNLGLEFNKRFFINYQKVYEIDYGTLLSEDLLNVAGYAWPAAAQGEYPRVDYDPNHAFMAFKRPLTYIFDNYIESAGDFIKKLASDYNFLDYGYRVSINKELVVVKKKNRLLQALTNWWQEIFR